MRCRRRQGRCGGLGIRDSFGGVAWGKAVKRFRIGELVAVDHGGATCGHSFQEGAGSESRNSGCCRSDRRCPVDDRVGFRGYRRPSTSWAVVDLAWERGVEPGAKWLREGGTDCGLVPVGRCPRRPSCHRGVGLFGQSSMIAATL